MKKIKKLVFFQLVDVMELVQVVCNVLIQQDNVLAMLVTKALIVMLLVVAIQQVQVVQHVMLLQVNAVAIQDTQEPHVILAQLTIIELAMELVQVRSFNVRFFARLKCFDSQPVDAMALVQVVCNVLILQDNVPARMATKEPNAMLLVDVIRLVQVAQHVMLLQVNVLVIQDTQEQHVILVQPTTLEQVMEPAQVCLISLISFN